MSLCTPACGCSISLHGVLFFHGEAREATLFSDADGSAILLIRPVLRNAAALDHFVAQRRGERSADMLTAVRWMRQHANVEDVATPIQHRCHPDQVVASQAAHHQRIMNADLAHRQLGSAALRLQVGQQRGICGAQHAHIVYQKSGREGRRRLVREIAILKAQAGAPVCLHHVSSD